MAGSVVILDFAIETILIDESDEIFVGVAIGYIVDGTSTGRISFQLLPVVECE